MTKINVNGVEREMTSEEITQRETDIADAILTREAEATAKTTKANGNTKLLDLGLTQAEATALTGYTPSVEEE